MIIKGNIQLYPTKEIFKNNFFATFSTARSVFRLLDALTIQFTENGAKSSTVQLELARYMQLCGLIDKKETRKQVLKDLEVLFRFRLSFKSTNRKGVDFCDVRLCDSKGIKNNIIFFNFSQFFYNHLKSYPIMPYPESLFKLKSKLNPNSYYFGRCISERKNMNYGKKSEAIISVKSLLESSPMLPKHEDTKGESSRYIIVPFERDMDALDNIFTWEYCNSHGEPLSDEQINNFTYSVFSNSLVKIGWREYPLRTLKKKKNRKKKQKVIKSI